MTVGLNSQETSRLEHAEFHIQMPSDHILTSKVPARPGHSFCVIGRTPTTSNARGVILRLPQNTFGQLDIMLCNAGLHPPVDVDTKCMASTNRCFLSQETSHSLRRLQRLARHAPFRPYTGQ